MDSMGTGLTAEINSGAVIGSIALEARNWFAVFTNSHHEKRVFQYLSQRSIESFLPTYSAVHKYVNRCKVKVDLPLFPNYLFVNIDRQDRARVLAIPGVLSIVGSGREPTPLEASEINSLRDGVGSRKMEPYPYLVVGEKARIKAGAFAGMEGVLLRKKNDCRIVLTLDQIMRSIAVEVDAFDIEPVKSSSRLSSTN